MSDEIHKSPPNAANLYSWTDITKEFTEAVKELELGELLHDNLFGLFEAMSAIEMMDPKMDAGMYNRDCKPTRTFDQLVEVIFFHYFKCANIFLSILKINFCFSLEV